ncbi:MAG: flagellar basal body P-ring formation protein FlgA [Phycisphaerales bacterium]|nr:flagellar basal body P-ring formation protein FlgA [Phycisphaerales bacterium]
MEAGVMHGLNQLGCAIGWVRPERSWNAGTVFGLRRALVALVGALGANFTGSAQAQTGVLRVHATAVCTGEQVLLGDICETVGLEADETARIRSLQVAQSPPPGGSRLIHLDRIRAALAENNPKASHLRLVGSTTCAVTRPQADPLHAASLSAFGAAAVSAGRPPSGASVDSQTLRQFLEDKASEETEKLGGRARLAFARADQSILDMTSPPFQFCLLRRSGAVLGAVSYEVDVFQNDRRVQSLTVRADVTVVRQVLVACRPILKDALVVADDVCMDEVPSQTASAATVADTSMVLGRRAGRFIAQGEAIDPTQLSVVPLVSRGQLVRVLALVGGIRLESIGEAQAGGASGEVVRVTLLDRKDEQLAGMVSGPGEITVTSLAAPAPFTGLTPRRTLGQPPEENPPRLAGK